MPCAAEWRRSKAECVSVAKVETIKPPMTARPSGADCAPPSPNADGHGHHAEDHGGGGHQNGAQAAAGAFARGIEQRHAFVAGVLGEGDQQDRIGDRDADGHDGAHERLHVQRGAGEPAASAARRRAPREWSARSPAPGARTGSSRTSSRKMTSTASSKPMRRPEMVCSSGGISPRSLTVTPLGGAPARGERLVQLWRGLAQREAVDVGGEADDALAVVAFDQAGHGAGFDARRCRSSCGFGAAVLHHGKVAHLLDALHAVLRQLHLDLEGIAGVRIAPVVRLGEARGGSGRHDGARRRRPWSGRTGRRARGRW